MTPEQAAAAMGLQAATPSPTSSSGTAAQMMGLAPADHPPAPSSAKPAIRNRGFFDKAAGEVGGTIGGILGGGLTIGKTVGDALLAQGEYGVGLTSKANKDRQGHKAVKLGSQILHADPIYQSVTQGSLDPIGRHPFQAALDVLPVAGAALGRGYALSTLAADATKADRAAALLKGRYQGPLRTINAGLGNGETVALRTLPRQGARAARMVGTNKALTAIDRAAQNKGVTLPGVNVQARVARAIKRDSSHTMLGHEASVPYNTYKTAVGKLTKRETVAFNAIRTLPLSHDLEWWRNNLPADDQVAQATLKVLNDPKVKALYETPSKRVQAALDAGRALSDHLTTLKGTQGLTAETAAASPWLHMRVARGAKYEPNLTDLYTTPDGETVRVVSGTDTHATVDVLRPNGTKAEKTVPVTDLTPVTDAAEVPFLHRAKLDGEVVGGPPIEDLKAEVAASGRPAPFYAPDQQATARAQYPGGKTGGLTPPDLKIRQNTGTLFTSGRVAMHIDTLGPAFLKAARNDAAQELHNEVVRLAVPSPDGNLATGYRWVRTTRGQKFTATATGAGEHLGSLEQAFPDLFPDGFTIHPGQPVASDEVMVNEAGQPLMVPEKFAHVLENDLRVQRSLMAKLDNRVMAVWRAMILKLRVPWLESNVFGNILLAGIRTAGDGGLNAMVGMIAQTKGVRAARKAVGLAEDNGKSLSPELVAKYMPEQMRGGTYIGSQTGENLPRFLREAPEPIRQSAIAANRAVNFLAHVDRATEEALRRMNAEKLLRGSEEVKAFYRAMPEQTRSWSAAMEHGLQNPDLNRLVSREINDGMGNFLSLTPAENGAMRTLMPFYAWFREILRITAKMPLDTPGRADILYKIGQVGNQIQASTLGPLPSYLNGTLALGPPNGDKQDVLALRAYNPWNSAVDVGQALGMALPGGTAANTNQALGTLNPFIQAAFQEGEKITSPHQAIPKTSLYGVPYDIVRNVVTGLPETRVVNNPPSKTYPGRTSADLLWQFLGYPKKTISRSTVAAAAKQGK